ncbi:hypothetical protein DRV85_06325 [Rhodosalinus halophilus]|uniref:DUF3618 domain-containing protein n=1 Tax=Rhodosalinus halophilus TaxID=2259333 RepID=A0A365UAW4_9RHOB|nr:DUF3618 domain-containing protein [Rhodosalinus halophilus]RBI86360.1 hypothetical protein DRV85_06325 [Rhodosalinus halophilus]
MPDTESPETIARDIAKRRAALAATVEELQSRAAPSALVAAAGEALRKEGPDLAKLTARRLARNPGATAMLLGGLAWLAAGRSQTADTADSAQADSGEGIGRHLRRETQAHPVLAGSLAALAGGALGAAVFAAARRRGEARPEEALDIEARIAAGRAETVWQLERARAERGEALAGRDRVQAPAMPSAAAAREDV